tara:strand:- start:313 stop:528 length:216 start_codon:yes stop_codon:yes gene_type:complete
MSKAERRANRRMEVGGVKMEPIIFWGMTEKELAEAGEAEAHAENGAIRYYESLGFDPESLDSEPRLCDLRK